MSDDKDYSTQSKAVIARREKILQKTKDLVDAFESRLHNLHKEMLRDADIKSSVSQEMINGVKGNAPLAGILAKLKGIKTNSADGLNKADLEDFGNADNTPTGLDDRYWDRDE